MKIMRIVLSVFVVLLIGGAIFLIQYREGLLLDMVGIHYENPFATKVQVPEEYSRADRNGNGIADPIDIVRAARKEVKRKTTYKSAYYEGGYPPEDEGVCTDVIWRGLAGAGIKLKDLIDRDISANTDLYPRTEGKPDPNIDFRRVPNLYVYLQRHATSLPTKYIPGDSNNLKQWQPGDIVVYMEGLHHVAIISDRRSKDGTPYIIHNNPPHAAEIKLKSIRRSITGHFRWKG